MGSETNPKDTAVIWPAIEELPHVIGEFSWTGSDYIGEAGIAVIGYDTRRQLYAPYPALLVGEPVIDITGHRQTQSYLNEIAWHRRADPYLAAQPVNHAGRKRTSNAWRATDSIRSWSWEGYEGTPAVVEVYADAHRVELLLNSAGIGSKPIGVEHGYLATFTVPYEARRAESRGLRRGRTSSAATPCAAPDRSCGCTSRPRVTNYAPMEAISRSCRSRSQTQLGDAPAGRP